MKTLANKINIHVIDAFTDVTFKGNSAAVILTEQWLDDQLMQAIAAENNLSETAFVKKTAEQHFDIRWFSPLTEIDFCGHATLAAAFVIFSANQALTEISFFAKAVGQLKVEKLLDGYIEMSFPNLCPQQIEEIPVALTNGLSIKPVEVLRSNQAYFVIYPDEKDVVSVVQNSEQLKLLAPFDVVVSAQSTQYDFVSRYFWPANGGDEDPVTGSIHAGLAPYWSEKLQKNELTAYQASKRGGFLRCRVDADRVHISGQAVQYLQGTISV